MILRIFADLEEETGVQTVAASDLPLLELATENAELRLQLAEAQDHLIEMAVDAGELHAQIGALQAELVEARAERDAWRREPTRLAS